ncbi:uncharacterized protein LOC126626129 isoform X2 [Malus sylvestris]|uniref:uncharacterized protein LOC126626129 isoform X2 n=1 Tax=Malus sylvestris TaxID=3752 RepID=UPI0021AC6CA9|nr:uncharacterized protein LOC126626129 isoform X2 [Malus sylvestris]
MCAVNFRFYPSSPRVLHPFFLSFDSSVSLYLLALHFLVSSSGFSSAFIVVRPIFYQFLSFGFTKLPPARHDLLIFGIVVGCSSLFLGANRIDFVFFAVLLTDSRSILGDLCIQVIVRQIVFSLVERFDG